jgi:polyisoprenoid-binding protein YceI
MKKQILFAALSIAAIGFSAFTTKEGNSTMSVNVSESKVVWLGKKVTGEHTGNINLKSGDLVINDGKLSGGSFVVDMNSITNSDIENEEYNGKLVGHLKSDDFFGVEKFPTAKFVIKDVKMQTATKYHIKGDMTIKGITHAVEFPAEISVLEDKAVASASITIDRSKYDVKYGSGSFFDNLGDKMIYDDFTLSITLVANK